MKPINKMEMALILINKYIILRTVVGQLGQLDGESLLMVFYQIP